MHEGMSIGGYRLLRQIGEGGMGAVWLAEHEKLGRRAAIKILHPESARRPDIVTRFFNEARAATSIADPGIIQIFDFGQHTDGSAYIVMELLEGEPLDQRLRRQRALSVGQALRLLRQVASSLGAAHARGIVHRDLKPENIFVIRDPEVAGGERTKLLDFGIAKLSADLGVAKTSTNALMGTPLYMSPEQCRGAGRVDARSDVYSLGCVAYVLVTGTLPFQAEGAGELIVKHMTELPPPPSAHAAHLPPELDALIMRCLAKDPDERFPSGVELAAALEALLAHVSAGADRMPTPPPGAMHYTPVPPPSSTPVSVPAQPQQTTLASAVFTSPPALPARKRSVVPFVIGGVIAAGAAAAIVVATTASSRTEPVAAAPPPPAVVADAPPPEPPPPSDSERATSAIQSALTAFATWASTHAGAPCPTADAIGAPADPWGTPLALTCTDQPANQVVGVISAGPDRQLGTDDDLVSWSLGKAVTDLARGTRWQIAAAPTAEKPKVERPKPRRPRPPRETPKANPSDVDGDGIPERR